MELFIIPCWMRPISYKPSPERRKGMLAFTGRLSYTPSHRSDSSPELQVQVNNLINVSSCLANILCKVKILPCVSTTYCSSLLEACLCCWCTHGIWFHYLVRHLMITVTWWGISRHSSSFPSPFIVPWIRHDKASFVGQKKHLCSHFNFLSLIRAQPAKGSL